MTSIHNPTPAEILAIAEDERHTLLAQAARDHLSNVRSEAKRYEETLAHIESVFRDRIVSQSEVPEWITAARKNDIATALRLVDAASLDDTATLIERAGLGMAPMGLRLILASAASDPSEVYRAWTTAIKILQAARR